MGAEVVHVTLWSHRQIARNTTVLWRRSAGQPSQPVGMGHHVSSHRVAIDTGWNEGHYDAGFVLDARLRFRCHRGALEVVLVAEVNQTPGELSWGQVC